MADEAEKEIEGAVREPRLYEISYLLASTLREEDAIRIIDGLKERMAGGGSVTDEGKPKSIQLAYTIEKRFSNKKHTYETALFGWVRGKLTPEGAEAAKAYLEKEDEVIRFLIVKPEREVPQPRRRPTRPRTMRKAPPREEKKPVDEEKLDKEIEELLAT